MVSVSQVGWAGWKDKSLVQRESNRVANKRVFKQITIQHAHAFVGVHMAIYLFINVLNLINLLLFGGV